MFSEKLLDLMAGRKSTLTGSLEDTVDAVEFSRGRLVCAAPEFRIDFKGKFGLGRFRPRRARGKLRVQQNPIYARGRPTAPARHRKTSTQRRAFKEALIAYGHEFGFRQGKAKPVAC
jgi:hypothetical protein